MAIQYGPGVEAALAAIGRTEDVHLCPGNRRLAIAGHLCHRVLVLGLEIDLGGAVPSIRLHSPQPIESAALDHPHGLYWVDADTLLVANRQGGLPVLRIPEPSADHRPRRVDPLLSLDTFLPDLLRSPGSVSARRLPCGSLDILVCNNFVHQVSQHLLDLEGSEPVCLAGSPLLAQGLDIPDGVVHSRDGRWIAVSNHNEHSVRLYDSTRPLGPEAEPDARLVGAGYPHGLRLSVSSRHVLVADAGAPVVHVYACPEGGWSGEQWPVCRLRVLDEETFLRGRYNPQEGGPKGLDIDRLGRVMVTTNEDAPLAFFDLGTLLGNSSDAGWRDAGQESQRPVLDAQSGGARCGAWRTRSASRTRGFARSSRPWT